MKSVGGLFEPICALENLRAAMLRAARGKRDRGPVARFLANAEDELQFLRAQLLSGAYRPRPYTQFRIMDPKPRRISCADFRDRVVHQALCSHIGPVFERRFVFDSFACRKGRGTHRAVLRARALAQRFRFFCKMDVERFFDSVDHDVLLSLLHAIFRERWLRELLERIVRHPVAGQTAGKGLPIGNLTSQWFANLYLDEADHQVKEQWRAGGYVRYMDDMLLFSDTKAGIWALSEALSQWLAEKRCLRVKQSVVLVAPSSDGIPFLGMRVFPRLLRFQHGRYHRSRRLVRRREREFAQGAISEKQLADSVGAVCAWARFFRIRTAMAA